MQRERHTQTSGKVICVNCSDEVDARETCPTCGAPDPLQRRPEAEVALDERLLIRIDVALAAQAELARRVAAERGETAARLAQEASILSGRIRRQTALLQERLAERRELIPALEAALLRAQQTLAADAGRTRALPGEYARKLALAPGSVRQAVTFIEQHPHEPIKLSDIAAAAGVTPRALQYGFNRHLQTGPLAYLRRVRLEHAHRALLDAAGKDGVSVRQIARQWGFANQGRFAAEYRAVYGRPPSHTLRP